LFILGDNVQVKILDADSMQMIRNTVGGGESGCKVVEAFQGILQFRLRRCIGSVATI
jgi:hypothetical protein